MGGEVQDENRSSNFTGATHALRANDSTLPLAGQLRIIIVWMPDFTAQAKFACGWGVTEGATHF
jgi:hypothetical protein